MVSLRYPETSFFKNRCSNFQKRTDCKDKLDFLILQILAVFLFERTVLPNPNFLVAGANVRNFLSLPNFSEKKMQTFSQKNTNMLILKYF